ncbi:MAG: pyruvate kinase [Candidatus Saccharimonadales bacterium]
MIFKRAKILATLGPATNSYDAIEKLIAAGVNGFRLNFSHGSYEERDQQIVWVRTASEKIGKPVAILQDIQGPKIRLGEVKDNHYEVKKGTELTLVYGIDHDGDTIPVQYDLSKKVKVDERLYIFDGKIRTTVTSVDDNQVKVRVENDGTLMSRKGINLPDTDFGGDILTEKDYKDLEYGAKTDIDYVALSFIQSAHDIETARGYLAEIGSTAHIIAKVETKQAIEEDELERIVEASDGVMVARGDLAVEVGAEIVPIVQRRIISLCQRYSKISIVATQMMASMVDSPEPTRAEVSDISNAVIVGADCLMLSDETANGKYPFEAVATMKRSILYTQEHVAVRPLDVPRRSDSFSAELCSAAKILASHLDAVAIIAETKSGATAGQLAAHRPSRPIISVTSVPRVAQQLALLYANKSFLRADGERAGLELAKELARDGFLETPATIVLVSGRQPGLVGATDTIRVRTL